MSKPKNKSKLQVVDANTPAPPLPDECCVKCRFFLRDATAQGVCRIRPPTPVFNPILGGVLSMFPAMLDAGWCGDFSIKKEADNVKTD